MEIINITHDFGPHYQARIRVTFETTIIGEERWYIIQHSDNGVGWNENTMPLKNLLRLQNTRALVANMGGTVEYHAKAGEGSVTTLKIPGNAVPEDVIRYIAQRLAEKAANRLKAYKQ